MKRLSKSKKVLSSLIQWTKNNSSLILSAASGVGVILTGVFCADAAVKTHDKIIEKRDNDRLTIIKRYAIQDRMNELDIPAILEITQDDKYTLTTKEVIDIWWKPVTIGSLTLASIIFNHRLNMRHQASLMAMAGASGAMFAEYRNKVIDIYGKDADDKMVSEIVKCKSEWYFNYDDLYEEDPNETITFYDPIIGYFECSAAQMYKSIYHLNRNIAMRGHINLSEWYDFLGIPFDKIKDPEYCKTHGWIFDELLEYWSNVWFDITFSERTLDDGMRILSLEYCVPVVDLSDDNYIEQLYS